jgi:hypothetical protein
MLNHNQQQTTYNKVELKFNTTNNRSQKNGKQRQRMINDCYNQQRSITTNNKIGLTINKTNK